MNATFSSPGTGDVSRAGKARDHHNSKHFPVRQDAPSSGPSPLRVLIADPEPLYREGLAAVLLRQPDIQIVGQTACGREALDMFCTLRPDLLIMEAEFADMRGKEVIAAIVNRFPASYILILSRHAEEETIYRALLAGARGYCLKETEEKPLIEAVRRVCAGSRALPSQVSEKLAGRMQRPELTARELEVLGQMVAGCSNQEVANQLFISEGTVKAHVVNIFRKMGAGDRTQAVLSALKRGLVPL